MKTQHLKPLLALLVFTISSGLNAQEKTSQAFWIHEDVVKPGMVSEYEAVCKELVDNMKKYNIQEMNSLVAQTLDNHYLWIGPIENMAQIDKPLFKTLAENMGEKEMGALFDRMDKCYDIEQNYVLTLDPELSYMPGGITQTPEGQPYRKFHYFHYTPGNRAAVIAKAKEIKKMFESNNSALDYRAYRSGFGVRGEYLMVAVAAKNAGDYAAKVEKNNEAMGEAWAQLYNEFMATLDDYQMVEGIMRPDMGYTPATQ